MPSTVWISSPLQKKYAQFQIVPFRTIPAIWRQSLVHGQSERLVTMTGCAHSLQGDEREDFCAGEKGWQDDRLCSACSCPRDATWVACNCFWHAFTLSQSKYESKCKAGAKPWILCQIPRGTACSQACLCVLSLYALVTTASLRSFPWISWCLGKAMTYPAGVPFWKQVIHLYLHGPCSLSRINRMNTM